MKQGFKACVCAVVLCAELFAAGALSAYAAQEQPLPDSGMIIIDGTYRLSFLFQEDRLLPWLNVYDNIALAFLNARRRFICSDAVGASCPRGSDASDLRRNTHAADLFTLQKHARLTALPASRQLSVTEIDRRIHELADALELADVLG